MCWPEKGHWCQKTLRHELAFEKRLWAARANVVGLFFTHTNFGACSSTWLLLSFG